MSSLSVDRYSSHERDLECMRNPNLLGQSFAWLLIFSGLVAVLTSLTLIPDLFGVIGFAIFGLGYLIPSIWWLHCKKVDRREVESYELEKQRHEDLLRYLSDEDELIRSGIGEVGCPTKKDRRWGPVIGISFIAFALGMVLFSFSDEAASQPGGAPRAGVNEPVL